MTLLTTQELSNISLRKPQDLVVKVRFFGIKGPGFQEKPIASGKSKGSLKLGLKATQVDHEDVRPVSGARLEGTGNPLATPHINHRFFDT